ncbi:alpha/beta hydrolase [Novosphingobium umbonatum]|uniref:Alpha/beta hydrolase n=1 Tax=Novosphingobium umbonatum TaxID=1908524 RepID=A0A3S2VRW7_9SPHN|nr:alpha/beta hydrolase [Novosphingobium umbonatum]RVU04078.1 alpha/beta hydrolase [Novosphingobium umbonatum]
MTRIASLCTLVATLVLSGPALAQGGMPVMVPAKAPADQQAIPLYGKANPGSLSSEVWSRAGGKDYTVRNVTYPTLTPVLPAKGKANGAAVVVAPGGAFMLLAMDHEGWKVAHALAARGITAFVLKYRLTPTPRDEKEAAPFMGAKLAQEIGHPMSGELLGKSEAPADGAAAIAYVRSHAASYGIDPKRIGMIGFSAGAMTARRVALDAPVAARPDFLGYIYGPQDAENVPADAPPMFDAIALDDALFPSKGFPIAQSWMAAKRPVEIHGYQQGNHGFGLGVPGTTTTHVLDQFIAWLDMQGFLAKGPNARKDSK